MTNWEDDLAEFGERASQEARDEYRRRIYYQNIVYEVCNELDKHYSTITISGTADNPSTHVIDRLRGVLNGRV